MTFDVWHLKLIHSLTPAEIHHSILTFPQLPYLFPPILSPSLLLFFCFSFSCPIPSSSLLPFSSPSATPSILALPLPAGYSCESFISLIPSPSLASFHSDRCCSCFPGKDSSVLSNRSSSIPNYHTICFQFFVMSTLHWNIHDFLSHRHDLCYLLSCYEPQVICLQETFFIQLPIPILNCHFIHFLTLSLLLLFLSIIRHSVFYWTLKLLFLVLYYIFTLDYCYLRLFLTFPYHWFWCFP